MTGTGEWAGLEDLAGLLAVQIGAWNHFGYATPAKGQAAIPPLGQRSADAIRDGHAAVKTIDELICDLRALQGQLVSELRADAMLAHRRDGAR
jgi:hypothetical protein